MRRTLPAVMTLLVLTTAESAFGWNKAGHMVIAAITYADLMQSDPDALANAIAILKEHPWYESNWEEQLKERETDAERNLLPFMLAAKWADDARGSSFDRPSHHFINFPYKPAGQPASVRVQQPAEENIITAFEMNLDVLRDENSTAPDKAVALTWIFHLVGDVHQPLHTSTLFTEQYPNGDRGGTRFYIRATEDAQSTITCTRTGTI